MTTNKAVYHYNCFSKYIDSKLKHFNKPSKKRKSTEVEKGRKLACLSAELGERFDLFCCWCSEKDVDTNLVPWYEHIRQQKLTTKLNHVKDLTAK